MRGAITTYPRVTWIVVEIVPESDSPSRRCRRGKLYWVGLRTWDPRIRQRKLSFQRWGILALLLIGRSPYRRFERDAGRPWGVVVDGGHRSWKIGFSYLPVVATRTVCLNEELCLTKSQDLLRVLTIAKHILRRYVDIWKSSYPEYRICVWRATGQKPLKYLLPRVATTISFKERYRVTLCLC